jgi:hypothetical protein
MPTYGYLRAASDTADNEASRQEILRYAAERGLGEVVFVELAASSVPAACRWKIVPIASLVNGRCAPGDHLIVPSISRIARSMQQIHQVLSVCENRGITLHILRNGIVVPGKVPSGSREEGSAGQDGRAGVQEPQLEPAVLSAKTAALFAAFELEIMVAASKEVLEPHPGGWRRRPGPGGKTGAGKVRNRR